MIELLSKQIYRLEYNADHNTNSTLIFKSMLATPDKNIKHIIKRELYNIENFRKENPKVHLKDKSMVFCLL